MSKVKRMDIKDNMREDQRGWVINPLEVVNIHTLPGNFHTASMTPSSIRGNHYHPNSTEWLFVFGGPALFYWRTQKNDSIHEEKIYEGEPALFEIPSNIVHVIKNNSRRDIYIMALTSSGTPDQVRIEGSLC